MDIDEKSNKLREFGELDGSEWGETALALCSMWNYYDYVSDEFRVLLEKEINDFLVEVTENAEIIEHERTITVTTKDLQWIH